ncbi:SPIRAL1-like protein 1, partial [Tanacetum coccineum]
MNRGVSSGDGQSSLNYLFGGGEAPKPALKATQAALAANNISAAKPDPVSPLVNVTKQIPAAGDHEDYSKDDHEVNSPQTETEIGSTLHDISVTRKETRALNEAKKRRLDKGKLVFEIDECVGRIIGQDSQRFITKG